MAEESNKRTLDTMSKCSSSTSKICKSASPTSTFMSCQTSNRRREAKRDETKGWMMPNGAAAADDDDGDYFPCCRRARERASKPRECMWHVLSSSPSFLSTCDHVRLNRQRPFEVEGKDVALNERGVNVNAVQVVPKRSGFSHNAKLSTP